MKYGSVCSGIEAATMAWHGLGWQAQWFAEIEKFPSAVLAHHYPDVPNLGDFTKIGEKDGSIDLLVGGTPCQSFSVAGKRLGLDDPRGNLAIEFLRLAKKLRPRWVVFENVPGILSSDNGRDFHAFLSLLGQCGYGYAYRVLDAQYFGVPQRRRRVFVIGYFGDWRPAAAVLFERSRMSRHPASRRGAGQITPTIPASGTGTSRTGGEHTEANFLIARSLTSSNQRLDAETENFIVSSFMGGQGAKTGGIAYSEIVAPTLKAGASSSNRVPTIARSLRAQSQASHRADSETYIPITTHTLRGEGYAGSEDGAGRGTPLVAFTNRGLNTGHVTEPVRAQSHGALPMVAFTVKDHGQDAAEGIAPTMRAGGHGASHPNSGSHIGVVQRSQVRRLTPVECERLQGFPDNFTHIPYRRKPAEQCPDGNRYKALGNSMAVPVMAWIGERIDIVDNLLTQSRRPT